MFWEITLITFGFMILGYITGSILGSVWVIKLLKLEDIRTKGSKNPGATNATRIHGLLVGFLVFLIDFSKPIIVTMIAYFTVSYEKVIIQGIIIATIIGHIFPLFHKFQGGKGIACMFGSLVIINWTLFIICLFTFLIVTIISKKSSLGSIASTLVALISYGGLSQINWYNAKIFEPITYQYPYWFNIICLSIIVLIIIWTHHENIKKLINKEEYNYR